MSSGLVVFGAKLAHGFASAPHFALAQRLEFGLKTYAVVGLGVAVDADLCFVTRCHALVETLHDGLDGVVEGSHPVERAALGGGGAVGIHPVHTVLGKQRHQGLGQLLYRLVEGFGFLSDVWHIIASMNGRR